MERSRTPSHRASTRPLKTPRVDAGLICIAGIVGVLTDSLALLAEAVFGVTILVRALAGASIVGTRPAKSTGSYEFGTGKLVEAKNLAVACAMIFAGVWLAGMIVGRMAPGMEYPTSRELSLAATVLAVITVRDGLSAIAFLRRPMDRSNPADRAEWWSVVVRFAALVVVQLAITVGALAADNLVSLIADAAGAALITILVTAGGVKLAMGAVSALIDQPLDRKRLRYVEQRLQEAGVEPGALRDLRARRSGRRIFLELTVDPSGGGSLDDIRAKLLRLRRALTAGRSDLDVIIRLHDTAA